MKERSDSALTILRVSVWKMIFQCLYLGKLLHLDIFPCFSSFCPHMDLKKKKKKKNLGQFAISKYLVTQKVGTHAITFWIIS